MCVCVCLCSAPAFGLSDLTCELEGRDTKTAQASKDAVKSAGWYSLQRSFLEAMVTSAKAVQDHKRGPIASSACRDLRCLPPLHL